MFGISGWNAEARRRNLHLLAYNTRFLICPGSECRIGFAHFGPPGEADAARLATAVRAPVYWLETFIDPARFEAQLYRAANWLSLGRPRAQTR